MTEVDQRQAPPAGAKRGQRHTGVAMGVRYAGEPLPGLAEGRHADALPTVAVIRASDEEIAERWAGAAAPARSFEKRYSTGDPFLLVESDERLGYRVWADGYGVHLVAPEGAALHSALPIGPEWLERRLLISQVLPLLAALHGREPLHASAVVVAGRLLAVTAPSGTGKSSTACHLIAQGGAFFADDVVALEVQAGRVRAHPGSRMTNVAEAELARLTPAALARLGRPLGTEDGRYFEPRPTGPEGSRPLDGLLVLERRAGGEAGFEAVAGAAATLLASAAIGHFDRPERLLRQLEVAAALEATVPLARLCVGAGEDAPRVAERVKAWAEGL